MNVGALNTSEAPGNAGKLDVEVFYNDNTSEVLATSDTPFSGVNIAVGLNTWYTVHGDGSMGLTGAEPTAATTVRQSATASARERLPLSATKTPERVDVFWTNN